MRVAVYYAPTRTDPLWHAGASWLGRDPDAAVPAPQPEILGIAEVTAEARRYGFHATLKPPMQPRLGWARLLADAEAVAARLAPFELPPLAIRDLHGFLALQATLPCPALQALANSCVEALDHHRTPPDAEELARRRDAGLSPAREANLLRWGYPDVFGTWRFHMTLTRRLPPDTIPAWRHAAERHLSAALAHRRRVEDICLFTQAAPGADFLLAERLPLRG